MTIQEALSKGKRLLKSPCHEALIETPDLDASLLLAETLHLSREGLVLSGEEPITESSFEKYSNLLERRRSGECVGYILGRKEFRGLEFIVNRNVLVPRPDTETLFEAAMEFIAQNTEKNLSVLDLCTGSGALAISLKKEYPSLSVTASDISAPALETAALNAGRLLCGESAVNFIHSDLFESIRGRFNIIVSNPPYIPSGEISNLAPEVRFEPWIALDGGEDGLALIRRIVAEAPAHLLPGAVLLLEAGPEQMPRIKTMLENNGFAGVRLHRDLAGRERVISGRLSRANHT